MIPQTRNVQKVRLRTVPHPPQFFEPFYLILNALEVSNLNSP